jgi:membrane-associated phospholipid phosphatase
VDATTPTPADGAGEPGTTGTPTAPVRRFTLRSFAGLLAVAATGVLFGLLLLLVRLHWSPLTSVDSGVADALNARVSAHPDLVALLKQVSSYGGRPFLIPLVAVAEVWLLLRKRQRLALYLAVAFAGDLLLDPAVKAAVGRIRPVLANPVLHAPGNSFPSGHALASMVVYGALVLVFLPALHGWWRRAVLAVAGLLVLAIGFTRVALGAHFVSDVLGGWLLGVAWLGATGYAFRLWQQETGHATAPVTEGLDPEAAADLGTPDQPPVPLAGKRWRAFEFATGWALIFGILAALGVLVTRYAKPGFDEAVPRWLSDHRTPAWDHVSWWLSKAGDSHGILFIALVFCALSYAATRRVRPVLFLALVMFGELSLFLTSAAAVHRPRPHVTQLDGVLPTSAFPSGHVAATTCLYVSIAVLVLHRTRAWWRWVTVVAAVVMPLLVAISRMYRGMHHPTDVLGGVLLAGLLIPLAYWLVRPNDLPPTPAPEGDQVLEPAVERVDGEVLTDAGH